MSVQCESSCTRVRISYDHRILIGVWFGPGERDVLPVRRLDDSRPGIGFGFDGARAFSQQKRKIRSTCDQTPGEIITGRRVVIAVAATTSNRGREESIGSLVHAAICE